MSHPDPQELQRLVDGELGARRTRAVSQHAKSCSGCAETLDRIRGTGALLRMAMDEARDDVAPDFDGLADRVIAAIEAEPRPLPWTERLRVWLGEFVRYRRRIWAPPLALAGAAAAVLVVVFALGRDAPTIERPQGSTVLSVSFGSTVDGTVFELEDKDGSTTAVIWVDQGKSPANGVSGEAGGAKGTFRWDEDTGAKST
jgi:anti-sigma factor RsiW